MSTKKKSTKRVTMRDLLTRIDELKSAHKVQLDEKDATIRNFEKETNLVMDSREEALNKKDELQKLLDSAVKLCNERQNSLNFLKKQAEEREAAQRDLIKDNNRMREMGPKNVLRAVKKLADQILEDYDDGLE